MRPPRRGRGADAVAADDGGRRRRQRDQRRARLAAVLFINVDLTVHLERMPEGEWVCVDAVTRPQPNGVGTAESVLSDRRGRIGRAAQTLLFAQRSPLSKMKRSAAVRKKCRRKK